MLKLNIIQTNTKKNEYKKIGYHGAIGIFIDCNDCDFYIFKEM